MREQTREIMIEHLIEFCDLVIDQINAGEIHSVEVEEGLKRGNYIEVILRYNR